MDRLLAVLRRIRCEVRSLWETGRTESFAPGHRPGGHPWNYNVGEFCRDCGAVLAVHIKGTCKGCGADLSRGWWRACSKLGPDGHVAWCISDEPGTNDSVFSVLTSGRR